MQYCSLQHRILLPLSDTSIAGCCFRFGLASSFLLELFLCSSPVAYFASTHLGSSFSVSYLFAFSYCSWGSQVSIQKWFAIPSPGNYVLSEFSPVSHPSCVALSFIELDIVISLISPNQWITREVPYEKFLVFSEYEEIHEI